MAQVKIEDLTACQKAVLLCLYDMSASETNPAKLQVSTISLLTGFNNDEVEKALAFLHSYGLVNRDGD